MISEFFIHDIEPERFSKILAWYINVAFPL